MKVNAPAPPQRLDVEQLEQLIKNLQAEGHQIIAPIPKDGSIVYDLIEQLADLPMGLTDKQEAGTYKLKQRTDRALFAYNNGPQSLKPYFFAARELLWQASKPSSGLKIIDQGAKVESQKKAFLGVRACDLEAIFIQDHVFINQSYHDPYYKKRREHVFIISINCSTAAPTCFCTSMHTGPKAKRGYDIALTEICNPSQHYFIANSGSDRGAVMLNTLAAQPASSTELQQESDTLTQTAQSITRHLDTTNIKQLLYANHSAMHWEKIAQRCLDCANCTMVCPTCFCHQVTNSGDLQGEHAERWRSWDSCFTQDFSHINGGSIRKSTKSHYRQWLTHKLASWQDQFGTSGCVGCGRCITWCPVGIDFTAEIEHLTSSAVSLGSEP